MKDADNSDRLARVLRCVEDTLDDAGDTIATLRCALTKEAEAKYSNKIRATLELIETDFRLIEDALDREAAQWTN